MKLENFIREFKLKQVGVSPNDKSLKVMNIVDNYLTNISIKEKSDGVLEISNSDIIIALYSNEHGGMINITKNIHRKLTLDYDNIHNSLIPNFRDCLSIIGYIITNKLNLKMKDYYQCYNLFD